MASSVTARNLAADGAAGTVTHVSMHTADPGTTGAGEVVGGTYARIAKTYAAAAAGTADIISPATFNVPSGSTVSHWGAWNGATFLFGGALAAPQAFASAGTYALNTAPYSATNPV